VSNAEKTKKTPRQWIERNGGPEPITPRFESFLETAMSGRSLDLEGDVETRPDYACLGGALVIEIKSLEGDPTERLENAIAPAKERETWPKFLGSWPLDAIVKNLPTDEADALKKSVFDRLGRAIVTHMKKANAQLGAFSHSNEGGHLKLLALINEDFVEYSPSSVTFIVQREFQRRTNEGKPRYPYIDAVLFLTERHATHLQGRVTFPIVQIYGTEIEQKPLALELMKRLVHRWGKSTHEFLIDETQAEMDDFIAIDENPQTMRQQDLWNRDYKRKTYMRGWADHDVIELWDMTVLLTLLAFHADPPMRVPKDGTIKLMETTSHLMSEFASRGIPMDRLKPTRERNEIAIGKVTYGPAVQKWLRQELQHID
jgi:hypothetical protein